MLKELVMKSRSVRSFDESRIISREELTGLIEICRYCPSSVNLQALKFTPVYRAEEVAQVQKLTRWAGLIKDEVLPPDGKHPTAFIIISFDSSVSDSEQTFLKDVGIVAQTIMLAAAEKGLGGCMIGSFDREKTASLLSLPASLKPELCLAIGKPDDKIVITDSVGGDVRYSRRDGVQYVPKRPLDEIIYEK